MEALTQNNPEFRADTVKRIGRYFYDNTESYERDNIGSELAYLLTAIASGNRAEVTTGSAFHGILKSLNSDDPVWNHVTLVSDEETTGLYGTRRSIRRAESVMEFLVAKDSRQGESLQTISSDLLTDLAHLCHSMGGDAEEFIDYARRRAHDNFLDECHEVGYHLISCLGGATDDD